MKMMKVKLGLLEILIKIKKINTFKVKVLIFKMKKVKINYKTVKKITI